jgi:hypothetical protein
MVMRFDGVVVVIGGAEVVLWSMLEVRWWERGGGVCI